MKEIIIREIQEKDIDSLAEHFSLMADEPFYAFSYAFARTVSQTKEYIRMLAGLKNSRLLVAIDSEKDEVIGHITLWPNDLDMTDVKLSLGVNKKYRKRGIAKRFLIAAEQFAFGKFKNVIVDVVEGNKIAIGIYKKMVIQQ